MLLLVALIIGVGAQFLVAVSLDEPITRDYYIEGAVFSAVALAFHLVLRFRAKYADPSSCRS